jgi:hypothetical protein
MGFDNSGSGRGSLDLSEFVVFVSFRVVGRFLKKSVSLAIVVGMRFVQRLPNDNFARGSGFKEFGQETIPLKRSIS